MVQYLVQKASFEALFNKIKENGTTIVAPLLKNNKILYGVTDQFSSIQDGFVQSAQSAKDVVFPRTEKLFGYTNDKDTVSLEDFNPAIIPQVVLWGVKPCDARAMNPLKSIFNWDSKDSIFNSRMEKITIIGFSCSQADESCFCTSVGGNPGSTEGSDILFTKLGDTGNYLAEVMTEKGKALADMYPEIFKTFAEPVDKEKFLASLPVKFDPAVIREKLLKFFNDEMWLQQSYRCLGCGACAFVCPTCACFDIQDEVHGKNGVRVRCWDSCGFSLFTKHTSGHNPRGVQSQRWRQRLLHKFSYMPERLSIVGCTGCGRCSRACPVDMNILEHLNSIQEA
jgi:sulfhydrogenase subunit beta (sulfur reductase)